MRPACEFTPGLRSPFVNYTTGSQFYAINKHTEGIQGTRTALPL